MYSKAVNALYKAKCARTHKWIRGSFLSPSTLFWQDCSKQPKDVKLVKENRIFNFDTVIPETVCSFTGSKDKNGRKVFLHDVLEYDFLGEVIRYVVRWEQSEMRYILENPNTGSIYFGTPESLTIVGNLYDVV